MNTLLILALAAGAMPNTTHADINKTLGFVPSFFEAVSPAALPGAWEEMKTLQMNQATALPGKTKELIGLAVAAQIPCEYCTFAHTEFAKAGGATNEEIGEALAVAALVRHWSTVLNGNQADEPNFRRDIMRIIDGARKGPPKSAPQPVEVVDGMSAKRSIEQAFGFVPDFFNLFPEVGLAGAWTEFRDVMLGHTALDSKTKDLIGLGVAAQIPCRYCTYAHTEFAKLGGATEEEIREAVAMAALTRHWSTLVNGAQLDKPTFKKEIQRLVAPAKRKHN
jgi:AhpD family alkylhydroperoxidase